MTLRARLGWGPEPPVGQRQAGARVGLSHQRVAQLERRVLDVLAATGPPPALVAAVNLSADMSPCTSAEAAAALYGERITGQVIHPAGVLAAAAVARVRLPIEVVPRRTAGQRSCRSARVLGVRRCWRWPAVGSTESE